jgi:hypothetical protein
MIIKSGRTSSVFDDHLFDCHGPLAAINHDMFVNFANFLAVHEEIHYADGRTQLKK